MKNEFTITTANRIGGVSVFAGIEVTAANERDAAAAGQSADWQKIVKKLGKKQRMLLKALTAGPVELGWPDRLSHITDRLETLRLVKIRFDAVELTSDGREFVGMSGGELFGDITLDRTAVVSKLLGLRQVRQPKFGKSELLFLAFLSESPRKSNETRGGKNIIPILAAKGLLEENDGVLTITPAGQQVIEGREVDNGRGRKALFGVRQNRSKTENAREG